MTVTQAGSVVTILILAALGTSTPTVQADESSDTAMRRELEEVREQLRELQLKVQRLEVQSRTSPAVPRGSAASSASSQNKLTPPPATPSQPVATEPAKGAPAPLSTSSPTGGAPQIVNPGPAATKGPEPDMPPAPPAVREALEWHETLKEQWHSVRAGMSSDEIKKLLGSPSRAFTLDGRPVWYYSYPGLGNGSVLFSRESHAVKSWQQPPLGFGFGFW
jgi:hypothetical protein